MENIGFFNLTHQWLSTKSRALALKIAKGCCVLDVQGR